MIDPELRAEFIAMLREAMEPRNQFAGVDDIVESLELALDNISFRAGDARLLASVREGVYADRGGDRGTVTAIEIVALLRKRLQRERGIR